MAKAQKTVKIIAHSGHNAESKKTSGVVTSLGDKFHGDIVALPGDEADLLILLGRAEESKPKAA